MKQTDIFTRDTQALDRVPKFRIRRADRKRMYYTRKLDLAIHTARQIKAQRFTVEQ